MSRSFSGEQMGDESFSAPLKFVMVSTWLIMFSSCCDLSEAKTRLDSRLNDEDIRGAIQEIDDPCTSRIPGIRTTQAVLIYRLGMEKSDPGLGKILRDEGIKRLTGEAAKGDHSAASLIEEYQKSGDAYFDFFPWDALIGPGNHFSTPREF